MSTRVRSVSKRLGASIFGALLLVMLVPMYSGSGSFQKAYADVSQQHVIMDHHTCVTLPLVTGTATFANNVCELSTDAFTRADIIVDKSVKLLNRGEIDALFSSTLKINGKLENLGTINLERGSVLIISPNALFTQLGTLNIDSTSGIVNHGTMAGSGFTNNGTIYNHCTGTITASPIAGNQPVNVCGNTTGVIVDATNQATGQSLYHGGRSFYGEWFTQGSSASFKTVDCVTVELRKHGSPTGMAQVTFSDVSGSILKTFGSIDVSTLKTGYKQYEFCLPTTDEGHMILPDHILAVRYDGGDPLNRIDVRRSNVGFGPDYAGGFHYQAGTSGFPGLGLYFDRDLLFKLTNS